MQTALGDVLRDEAIDRVASKNDAFLFAADAAIDALTVTYEPFTSEDVWAMMPDGPTGTDPRAMGAAFRDAQKKGWIRPLGYVKGSRAVSHGRFVREWIGVPLSQHDRRDWKHCNRE